MSRNELDKVLARRIALLLRAGTILTAVLLVAGVLSLYRGAVGTSNGLLASGCGLLVVLPAARLVVMFGHFARRSDQRFAVITALVIVLIVTGAAVGIAG